MAMASEGNHYTVGQLAKTTDTKAVTIQAVRELLATIG